MATFSGIGKLLKDVIFSDLSTSSKNVIGAINELNTGLNNASELFYSGTFYGASVVVRKLTNNALSVTIRGTLNSTLTGGTSYKITDKTQYNGYGGSFVTSQGIVGHIIIGENGMELTPASKNSLSGWVILSCILVSIY